MPIGIFREHTKRVYISMYIAALHSRLRVFMVRSEGRRRGAALAGLISRAQARAYIYVYVERERVIDVLEY